ncbi:unnamed protein product, partial [Rotaria sp. Silwood1]
SLYSKEALTKAIEEYKNGSTSSELTTKYGIPGSTIRNHKSNSKLKVGGGRPTLLTDQQEQYLVELLINLELVGVRLTKPVVIKLSSEYAQAVSDKDILVGRKWLTKFLQRWKTKLKVLKEKKMEISRRNGFTEDVRVGWYAKLDLILRTNNLKTRPHAIFNCDESGFSDESAGEMVIVSHETKEAYEQSGGSGKCFTTSLMCSNAAGEILPPFIIYSAKSLNPQWTFGGPPGSSYAVSESGWINGHLYVEWFKWFIEHTKNISKPILLIMDNHPSHQVWKNLVSKYFSPTDRRTIRKIDLPGLFTKLYQSAFTSKQVLAGFVRAGVWPFNPDANKDKVVKQPLTAKQLNPLPQTTNSTNLSTSSTQYFLTNNNTTPVIISSISSSSSSGLTDSNVSTMVMDIDNSDDDELNRLLNEIISSNAPATAPENYSPSTTMPSSFTHKINFDQQLTTNQNMSTLSSSFLNPSYSFRFPSFVSDVSMNTNSSNQFESSVDKSNNTILPVDTNSSIKQTLQSTESISTLPTSEIDLNEVDDGQKIIGFDSRTLPTTDRQNSFNLKQHPKQRMSLIEFEIDDDEENRMDGKLIPVHIPTTGRPSQTSEFSQVNIGEQIVNPLPSNQMSPSTAVRSILVDLLQQYTPSSSSLPKTHKRKRIEGIYGEEITSSGRLDELKQKKLKPNRKRRTFSTTEQTGNGLETTTTAKKRKLSKKTSETITSSQVTRAIATVRTLSSIDISPDQNDISSSHLHNQQ